MGRARWLFCILAGAAGGALFVQGCSDVITSPIGASSNGAGSASTASSGSGGGGTPTTSSGSGSGGASTASSGAGISGGAGQGGVADAGPDVIDDVLVNPCGTGCGPVELCDPDHVGLDDDCDGLVDEGCPCVPGEVHPCFEGDPSFHGVPGCFDGSEVCGPNGQWGPCVGGVHATPPDHCYANDTSACHAIAAIPFAVVNLADGIGLFGSNAVPGSEAWTVQCPAGVNPCPAVIGGSPKDDYKPLQSGEYTVTYTKSVAGQPAPESCSYPLLVGAPGLRVELAWEHPAGDEGADLDLHVHQPGDTQPWGFGAPKPQDCTWSNCVFSNFAPPQDPNSPAWFLDPPAMPPQPVNWSLSPILEQNGCYFAPNSGSAWQSLGMGCHNPRLDIDVVTCDPLVKNSNEVDFCGPENINIDYPPQGAWTRIGVHYYSNHDISYDLHPTVKVFCNGALAAVLGPGGYHLPEAPVTFAPSDGAGVGNHRFWLVADVAFTPSPCGAGFCEVRPLHADPAAKTPLFTTDTAAANAFGPPYPPPP